MRQGRQGQDPVRAQPSPAQPSRWARPRPFTRAAFHNSLGTAKAACLPHRNLPALAVSCRSEHPQKKHSYFHAIFTFDTKAIFILSTTALKRYLSIKICSG